MVTGGGADTVGPAMATKRRRRREQMEEDDSSDLSDESDDEPDQRAAQQIKFAKMPVRSRAGSSPIQSSNLRQPPVVASPRAGAGARRGSQSALETVKERARRDTVTSSEVSSENEFDMSGHRHRDTARAMAKAAKLQARIQGDPIPGIKRQDTELLPEEEEDSDASDMSGAFVESVDSASILNGVENPINPINASPREQVVGTPPREFTRQSTIRKSRVPVQPKVLEALPPPRPMSTIRPISMIQPKSLLSAALNAKKTKPAMPFERFANLSGQGESNPIALRIYAPGSTNPEKPFEVLIRRNIHEGESVNRQVTVADLIGLSLWRYNEEKLEPGLPSDKMSVNWWSLRMVEEGGEVDDDFPPLERKKPLVSFTMANNRAAGRLRANSKTYDDFALVQASQAEYAENKSMTPQFEEQEPVATPTQDEDMTPRNTPQPNLNSFLQPKEPRQNPVTTTGYRTNTMFADMPQAPAASSNTTRGQQKLLRIHILSSDVAPGQMVTLDVTTETYLAEVLDLVCRKRQLDKANHVLKLPGSGAVVLLDRAVSSIGAVSDLELYRRRFATDGPLTITGSPSSSSPKHLPFVDSQPQKRHKKAQIMGGIHPLAQESMRQDEFSNGNYKKYTVWRKQPMRIVGTSERILTIDGEYIHIMPASGGKALLDGGGKTTTVHFSNVVGCKVPRKHPTNFKVWGRHLLTNNHL
jgi:target of rapamycin complex 2 subunit MAPKAP1